MSSWYSNEGGYPTYQGPMPSFETSEPRELLGLADETTATQPSIMLGSRKIPEAEWQLYKEEIQILYLTENKTREEVMTTMEKTHGFQASKAQYIRKLDLWGFKKNSTNEKWNYIAQKLQKRDLDGKESDTYINGKLVARKKIKKELSRHTLPSWQIMSMTAPSPPPPGGIEIRTPPREHEFFVEYLHIPWFEFETLVEPQIKQLRALAYGHHSTPSLGYDQLPQTSPNFMTQAPIPQMAITTDQWLHQIIRPRSQMSDAVQELGNDKQGQKLKPSTSRQTQDQEARFLFAKILGKSIDPDSHDYLSKVASHLDEILVERQDGNITRNVQRFFGSRTFEIALQLLRYSIYLSSNNLLSNNRTDDLLEWVVRSGQFAAIEHLIKMKTPTTEVFASNILLSATRMEDSKTVRALLALGIDVNIPGGDYPKKVALLAAVSNAKYYQSSWLDRQRLLSLVKIFLEAGADINVKSGYHDTSPLQEAISTKNVELVQILLSTGVALNAPTNDKEFPGAALLKAARDGYSKLIKTLLKAKSRVKPLAKPFMITLLQDATMRRDLSAVQSLLDSGADVDAPAGVSYDVARQKAVESRDFQHLRSAIQIAAAKGETEMVQVLLEAGANVDGYLLTEEEHSFESRDMEIDIDKALYDDDRDIDRDTKSENNEDDSSEDDSLENGDLADFHSHYRIFWTPLQSAVAREDAVLVRVLLQAGANVEGQGVVSTPLQLAVLKNNTKLVQLMLREGADINAPAYGVKGRTALQAAVENCNHELIEILIDGNANLNAPASSNSGFTVLQAAVHVKNFELVRWLISLGADVNAVASPIEGRTCLQAAAGNGDTELVQFLLSSGAEVNAAAAAVNGGLTALQAAARGNHLSVVKVLLAAGADVNAPSTQGGYSAVYAAVKRSNLEMLQLFLKTASPNGQADRVPPLLKASRKGATEIVQYLLQKGADINASRTEKLFFGARTAIEAAVEYGHEDIFNILLDAGTGTGVNGQVLALGAALGAAFSPWSINMDIVRKLLKAGADVNRAFPKYDTPLLSAVWTTNLDLIQTLLNAGADVNCRGLRYTALQITARVNNLDVVRLLLNAGADVNAPAAMERGRTALQAAAERGDPALVRLLLEQGADCNAPAADSKGVTALQAAAVEGRIPIAWELLKAGANINAPAAMEGSRTALQAAAEHGHPSFVRLLLEQGADCNAPAADSSGVTALQAAAVGGHLPIALTLLEAGADINAPAAKSNGRTALEAAAEHGRLDITSLLLKNDTDTEGLERRCERAAELAEGNGHIHISRMLRNYNKG